jgi:hypothetical protein
MSTHAENLRVLATLSKPGSSVLPTQIVVDSVVVATSRRLELEDEAAEAEREHLLEMLEDAGIEDDELPPDMNVEGDPTRNGAF